MHELASNLKKDHNCKKSQGPEWLFIESSIDGPFLTLSSYDEGAPSFFTFNNVQAPKIKHKPSRSQSPVSNRAVLKDLHTIYLLYF